MPGFTTHYLIGQNLRHHLKDPSLNQLLNRHKGAFDAGLQGPDIFFYNIFFVAGPISHNVGKQMHEHHTGRFFDIFLSLAEKEEKRQDRETAIAYFLGFLCHYTLDTKIHPYVYARCNCKDTAYDFGENPFTRHTMLESIMDVCLLRKEKDLLPSAFYQTKTLHLKRKERNLISRLMTKTIKTLYGLPAWYQFSYLCMKLGTFVLHDKTGRKRKVVLFLEKNIIHSVILSGLIENDGYQDTIDAFNKQHQCFVNPWDSSNSSTQSVYDMIDDSYAMYETYTAGITPYLCSLAEGIPDVNYKKDGLFILGNLSYHSGLDCL